MMLPNRETAKRLLARFGLEVRRVNCGQKLPSHPRSKTSGKICEFVGVSGVGKSTLFNASFATQDNSWFFERHVRQAIPPNMRHPKYEDIIRDILEKKAASLNSRKISVVKLSEILTRISEIMLIDSNIVNGKFARGIALDEGIAHFFAEEIQLLDSEDTRHLFQNRRFVYLRSDSPKRILGQTFRRQGMSWPEDSNDPNFDVRNISDQIRVYDDLWQKICEYAQDNMVLNAHDDMQENIEKCLNFEKALHSS